ncbi:poly [ADP-ribose] polymerase 2-like [Mytilus californianus]|uniref:poly [ADP-ribose] polymerase 2-like n=1 Tax=Mytilus californianus TaxID=6549 RepID=UPI0022473429|nr:poly [ADP-ribose] polymerase 2-like [Mytilus californianus]
MPRRKKTDATEDGSGDSVPTKKSKLGSQIDGVTVRWEWEGDKSTWTKYSDDKNENITDAFNSKKPSMSFDVAGGASLEVVFDKMVQKNSKTGWSRRVRLAVKDDKSDDYYVWQWEDEKGKWNPYNAEHSIEIENARISGKDLNIVANHRAYDIDFAQMEQVNTVTNVARTIDRCQSDAVEPIDSPKKVAPKRVSSRGDAVKVKVEPEDEPMTSKSAGKGKGKAAKSGRKKGKSGADENGSEGKEMVKTVVIKGKAPVDSECTQMLGKAHVFYEGKDIWDCMLNQTNVGNNNNKYFMIQLLEEDSKKSYHVWFRWGRVGYKGQNNLVPCGSNIDLAKKTFCKKFTDKTKNDWANRSKFVHSPGKYDMLAMDYGEDSKGEDVVDTAVTKDIKYPDSKLDKSLQNLIDLICDVKSMEDAVKEMKYDAKKAPLGKLTTDQVKAGYASLKKIETCINKGDFGQHLTQACNEFYTRIPHTFGMSQPPLIRSKEEVKAKIQLLEALSDIEIAIKVLKQGDMSDNPIDRHYKSLNVDLVPVEKSSDDYKMVNDYLLNTHASTHSQYKMEIVSLFEMKKHGEDKNFKDLGNRQLLWHGSRLSNWVGILSQGLRIAPPEAPVTGYMFGKGVYFADMSSKSANYCFASRSKNIGCILLSEVSLGKTNDLLAADYKADKLPTGKHSVRGLGSIGPDPSKTKTLSCGTAVPLGKPVDTGVKNPAGYTLNYNEFIVYNTQQIKMKYLLQVKFKF